MEKHTEAGASRAGYVCAKVRSNFGIGDRCSDEADDKLRLVGRKESDVNESPDRSCVPKGGSRKWARMTPKLE